MLIKHYCCDNSPPTSDLLSWDEDFVLRLSPDSQRIHRRDPTTTATVKPCRGLGRTLHYGTDTMPDKDDDDDDDDGRRVREEKKRRYGKEG